MKKLILLLIVILPLSLSAQRFHGGLLAGMNVSQIDGDTWAGFSKAGFVGGAYVFTDFTEKWGAQLEIKYSSKGSASPKYSYDNIKFRLRYIEIPILANYNIVKKFAVHGGLSIGFLFDAQINEGYGYEKFEGNLNKIDWALCLGLSYSFFDRVSVNMRYSYSIVPIASRYTGATGDTGAWFNNVITFGFYFKFG